MTYEDEFRDAFPVLNDINSDELEQRLVDVWTLVHEESDFDSIHDVSFMPGYSDDVGEQSQIDHLQDVVACSLAVTEALEDTRGVSIDRDVIIAGALTHDIDKPLGASNGEWDDLKDLVPHPYMGVYLLQSAGFSNEVIHIALSHSPMSSVNPKTIEAKILQLVDLIVVQGVFWKETGSLLGSD